ncbi:hypothetical protein CEXT_795651 [Caerostris extrusa]|uniref:Uncharacterized protein n=1 Tax=Caerostris extrusa TaxID=172846 RepID=A0AAV4X7X9_CAEEX|nr:hypothetical protein CEXT_795651 [Caerostris extrusa]
MKKTSESLNGTIWSFTLSETTPSEKHVLSFATENERRKQNGSKENNDPFAIKFRNFVRQRHLDLGLASYGK